MADPFAIEPPGWLQAIAKPVDTKLSGEVLATALGGVIGATERTEKQGGSWLSNLGPAIGEARLNMLDPLWRTKAEHAKLGVLQDMLGLVDASQKIQMARSKMANMATDLDTIPAWMREHPTFESRQQAQWPAALTPEWNRVLDQQRLRDVEQQRAANTSAAAKIEVDTTKAFTERVGKLPPQLASQFGPVLGKPPTAVAWKALSIAEDAHRQMQDVDIAVAQAQGATITQTTGPKGETTIVKQGGPPAHQLGQAIPVSDPTTGAVLGHVISTGPNTGHFQPVKTDVLTAPQRAQVLRTRGNVLKAEIESLSIGRADPDVAKRRAALQAELSSVNEELKALGGGAAPPVPPAGTPKPKYRVNEKTGLLEPVP